MFNTPYFQIALLLAAAGSFATVAFWFKQPLLIGYLLMGLTLGNLPWETVALGSEIDLLAKIGVTILLFLVGLRLDVTSLRQMGKVAFVAASVQMGLTFALGYGLCLWLGFSSLSSFYLGAALTFSSTIIVVKILSDQKEIESLHGRIAVGILILQDIAAIVLMFFVAAAKPVENPLMLGITAVVIIGVIALLIQYVLGAWTKHLADSRELLMLFGISWALVWACIGEFLGFGTEVGAFAAGLMLASTPYQAAIGARLAALRDFLLPFFFLQLGSHFHFGMMKDQWIAAGVLSICVLCIKPLLVMAATGFMGYRRRTGFLAGITLAQISEFSILLVALGVSLGHIGAVELNLVTLVALITITLSTFALHYALPLFHRLEPYLGIFERTIPYAEQLKGLSGNREYAILLIGLGRYGVELAKVFRQRGLSMVVIDYDNHALERAKALGIRHYFGDVEDNEFIEALPLSQFRWVVSTIRNREVTEMLISSLKENRYPGQIAVTDHAAVPVDLVLHPYKDAAERAVETLLLRDRHAES